MTRLRPASRFALLGALLVATSAQAQSEGRPGPEEFFLGDVVFSQERGEVQLTAAPSLARADAHRSLRTPLSFEVGLTDAWQVEAGWSLAPFASEAEHEVEVGTQYTALNVGGGPVHAAVGVEAEWEGAEFEAAVPYLVLATAFGRVHAFVQGAVPLRSDEDADEGPPLAGEAEGRATLIAGAALPVGPAFVTAEAAWTPTGLGDRLALAPGVAAPLADGWQLGLALPVAWQGGRATVGLSAFVAFEFEVGEGD